MPFPTRHKTRRAVLAASLALSALSVFWLLRARANEDPVRIVGMTSEVREMLTDRADAARPPQPKWGEPGFPPPLVREPLDEKTAQRLCPIVTLGRCVFDPDLHFRREPNKSTRSFLPEHDGGAFEIRTNSLGMKERDEPSLEKPRLRALVTGASNVEGVCANEETATSLLEAALRERMPGETVEVLNTGTGAYNFYNFLAVLERYRDLRPDVFVVVAYGGNDFFSAVRMHRYFEREGPPSLPTRTFEAWRKADDPFRRLLVAAELAQVVYMLDNPGDVDIAVAAACSATAEMQRLCGELGVRLVCAYLPPPLQGQPPLMTAYRDAALGDLKLSGADLEVSDRIADSWLAFLEARGIVHVDLRPAFRASPRSLYWRTDTHINLDGQRVVADALLPLVASSVSSPRAQFR